MWYAIIQSWNPKLELKMSFKIRLSLLVSRPKEERHNQIKTRIWLKNHPVNNQLYLRSRLYLYGVGVYRLKLI